MSKIKFEIDLNDMFENVTNQEGTFYNNFDEWVEYEIATQIKKAISDKIDTAVNTIVNKKFDEVMLDKKTNIERIIGERLNDYMETFFTTPYDVKDKYGDVIQKNVSVKQLLKDACDNFIDQRVDKDGRVVSKSSYGYLNTMSRIDYIVNKTWSDELKYNVDKCIKDTVKGIKEKMNDEISKQMGKKLAEISGLNDIIEKL